MPPRWGFELLPSHMANTYTQIHLQIVFAVQGRRSLIPSIHAQTLYQYITGIVNQQGQKLLAINGMPDHLHLLIGLRPDKALSDLMREVKANSSKFINEQQWMPGKFLWQEGFGAFSYGASQLPQVIRYIERQQEHHAKRTFAQEYELLLQNFGVEYNPKYVFAPAEDVS
jgi:REP element-mobilizing transposase RayT